MIPDLPSKNPVRIVPSSHWLNTVRDILDERGLSRPLVVTSQGAVQRNRLLEQFPESSIFAAIEPNPTFESCQTAINFALRGQFDSLIALGGGSVMDSAKAVMAALGTGNERLTELLELKEPFKHRLPAIFIPTTHGTASEVTMWGTIWNLDEMKKYSLSHPDLYPDVAVLDAALTLELPLNISLTSALDALSHSFEAIWNRNATKSSTDFAVAAIGAILENAKKLKADPGNLDTRRALLEAATTAGLAFSQTKTAAAHSISYPLTLRFGIPHGIASSLALIPLLHINKGAIRPALEQLLATAGLATIDDLEHQIRAIPEGVLKYRLRDWGVGRDDLASLLDQSFFKGRIDNNIVTLSTTDVAQILELIY